MKHLFFGFLSAASLALLSIGGASAQKTVLLPLGALVVYSGAECGQIDGTWLPGTITGKGQFVSLNASLLTLNKQLKKTPKAKKGAVKKKIAALKKRILSQATTCQQLGTGIIAPRSSQSATAGATIIDWTFDLRNASASDFGSERSYFCPPNGQQAAIYGSDTYTADSAVCPAAVHAGVVTFQHGGNVKLRIKAGLNLYLGGIRNGITSSILKSFGASYSFINPSTGSEVSSPAPTIFPWSSDIAVFRERSGLTLTFICPANGSAGTIYGTDTYTDDSEVCAAAAHAGITSVLRGGEVRVVVSPGAASYTASTRNGISSFSYGSWPGSILFQ